MTPSLLAQMPPEVRERVYLALRFTVGNCPGCSTELAVVYRSSRRSVTMRCGRCGLLWTMTIHQIAKSLQARMERMQGSKYAPRMANMAQDILGWAGAISETRGREKHATGQTKT